MAGFTEHLTICASVPQFLKGVIMKTMFKKVTIVGMGMMGGSLGMALLKNRIAKEVCGAGRNIARLNEAKKLNAATMVTDNLEEAVKGADLIVISVVSDKIAQMYKKLLEAGLAKETIVTDMGSVKKEITDDICALKGYQDNFIGSHPMVGSEKTGVKNSIFNLFNAGNCIVTGNKECRGVKKVTALWKSVGMHTVFMTPQQHDDAVAGISHMPHLAAFALLISQKGCIKNSSNIIGSGFKSMTRIGASDEEVWAGILYANKAQVLKQAERFRKEIEHAEKMLKAGKLAGYIKAARLLRESLDK